MPRLSKAYRKVVRLEIVEAAVHCFARHGLDRTSIADVAAEGKSSAGSIYTHFQGKADLVRAVAHAVVAEGAAALGMQRAIRTTAAPDDILRELTATIHPETARVLVQLWGMATTDPAVRGIIADTHAEMRELLQDCVVAWLVEEVRHDRVMAAVLAKDIADRLLDRYRIEQLNTALDPQPGEHGAWQHVFGRTPRLWGPPDSMARFCSLPLAPE